MNENWKRFFAQRTVRVLLVLAALLTVGIWQNHAGYMKAIKPHVDEYTSQANDHAGVTMNVAQGEDGNYYAHIKFTATVWENQQAKLILYAAEPAMSNYLQDISRYQPLHTFTVIANDLNPWETSVRVTNAPRYGQVVYILTCAIPSKCPNLTTVAVVDGEFPLGMVPTPMPTQDTNAVTATPETTPTSTADATSINK